MRVNFTAMGEDSHMHQGQVTLAMVQVDAAHEAADDWARQVTEVGGKVTESEASCANGHFRCQGDAAWCAEQEKLVCNVGQLAFSSRRPSRVQGHLQA
jgi:hypothetical protein